MAPLWLVCCPSLVFLILTVFFYFFVFRCYKTVAVYGCQDFLDIGDVIESPSVYTLVIVQGCCHLTLPQCPPACDVLLLHCLRSCCQRCRGEGGLYVKLQSCNFDTWWNLSINPASLSAIDQLSVVICPEMNRFFPAGTALWSEGFCEKADEKKKSLNVVSR